MPSFTILSAIKSRSKTGAVVTSEMVGEELYWMTDIPDGYIGRPTCNAYSRTSNSGSPYLELILNLNWCSSDADVVGNWQPGGACNTLYAFRFYNSNYIYIECSVKLGHDSSSQCGISCSKKKQSVDDWPVEQRWTACWKRGALLHHISAHGGNGTVGVMGCSCVCWTLPMKSRRKQ